MFDEATYGNPAHNLSLWVKCWRRLRTVRFISRTSPISILRTRTIVAAETLVRWRHPTRGLIPPYLFVPMPRKPDRSGADGRGAAEDNRRATLAWRERLSLGMSITSPAGC